MLQCKDCDKWYGGEDDEFGPCNLKHMRGDRNYITFGYRDCDEPDMLRTLESKKG